MAASDPHAAQPRHMLPDSYAGAVAIAPNDGADLAAVTVAILVGVAGDVAVVMKDGTEATLKLPVGIHRLRIARVKATDTTATSLVALY